MADHWANAAEFVGCFRPSMALYSIGHSCLGAEHRAKVVRIDGNEPIIRNDGLSVQV